MPCIRAYLGLSLALLLGAGGAGAAPPVVSSGGGPVGSDPRSGPPVLGPGRQRACQEQVDAAGVPAPRLPLDAKNLGYLNPFGRTVDCEGAEEVRALTVREPSGKWREGDLAMIQEQASPLAFALALVLDQRVPGAERTARRVSIGLRSRQRGREAAFGIFGATKPPPEDPSPLGSLQVSPLDGQPIAPVQTAAPWVRVRLDDGAFYFGQFQDGFPHGFGLRMESDGRARRLGWFRWGLPDALQVIWEDETLAVRLPVQQDPSLRVFQGGIERIRQVVYQDGIPRFAFSDIWSMWALNFRLPDGGRIPRRYRLELGIPTLEKASSSTKEPGDIVWVEGKYRVASSTKRLDRQFFVQGRAQALPEGLYPFVMDGQEVEVEGIGFVVAGPETRARLGGGAAAVAPVDSVRVFDGLRRGDLVGAMGGIHIVRWDPDKRSQRVFLSNGSSLARGEPMKAIDRTTPVKTTSHGTVEPGEKGKQQIDAILVKLDAEAKQGGEALAARLQASQPWVVQVLEAAKRPGPSMATGRSSGSGYPATGSSLGSPAASSGPRIGTEAWHQQRSYTHPITYYQNKY